MRIALTIGLKVLYAAIVNDALHHTLPIHQPCIFHEYYTKAHPVN